MSDDRVDRLVRRLDVDAAPPPDFVAATFTAIEPHAAAARGRRERGRWMTPLTMQRRLLLVAAAALLALLAWSALGGGGPREGPLSWQAHTILYGRAHEEPEGYDLWTVGRDGGTPKRLAAGGFETSRVSPDGSRIAIPVHGSVLYVRILTIADGTTRDLHPDPSLNLGVAAWSHDGQWLALEGWDDAAPDRAGVWLMRVDGSELHRLSGAGVPGDFSPDDRQVLVTRQEGLFIVSVDGTDARQIGVLKPVAYASAGFLPDGRTIYAAAEGKLWLIDTTTEIATPFEVPGGALTSPRVSPDGRSFVFTFDALTAPTTSIWQMRVDGTLPALVVDDPTANEDFADWLP